MATSKLEAGRAACARRAWQDALDLLAEASAETELDASELELYATAAYLVGNDERFYAVLERAQAAHARAGDSCRAARAAFWLGLTLMFAGESARASGWLTRARRLVAGLDCAEQGYLMVPDIERELSERRAGAAHELSLRAVEIGERFGETELSACARHLQGRALIQRGDVAAGLSLLDDVMLTVIGGELGPIMAGLLYCSVIEECRGVFAFNRARQWTDALTSFCEAQPQMNAFRGTCLVCRAEILQISGAWPDAMREASLARQRLSRYGPVRSAPAVYQQAELHRLGGDVDAAEEAYRTVSRLGGEPQPGLALLRLAQGKADAAFAALERVLAVATEPFARAKLLGAFVEAAIAAGNPNAAEAACNELETIASANPTDVLGAVAAHARGALELSRGAPRAALEPLGRAFEAWQALPAPYEAGRVRVLRGLSYRALGDREAAELELHAAREIFVELGARVDLDRLDRLRKLQERTEPARVHPLTARELEVLRLVAAGKTNKLIAVELGLSERTIDRHMSNVLTKLGVPSRAAAVACAVSQKLV